MGISIEALRCELVVREALNVEIPVSADAEVECTDGPGGRCTNVVIDPVVEQVMHIVVREHRPPHSERLVPMGQIAQTTPEVIHLSCTQDDLAAMDAFVEQEYVKITVPAFQNRQGYVSMGTYAYPYLTVPGMDVNVLQEHEHVPAGELAVRRGATVEATDGYVGRVDEFLVDPANGHITHLVLHEGHLWGQKDVTVPVSQIGRYEEGRVYLQLDKRAIELLPPITVHRPWWS